MSRTNRTIIGALIGTLAAIVDAKFISSMPPPTSIPEWVGFCTVWTLIGAGLGYASGLKKPKFSD